MVLNSGLRQNYVLILFLLVFSIANGNQRVKAVNKSSSGILDVLDDLEKLHVFPDSTSKLNSNTKDNFPAFPDLVYEYKIAALGKLSPIDFDYNPKVRRYIDIYANERREQVSQMLGLADLYFPLFEDLLDKYHLPLELKYLSVVESGLNPLAVSKTGAVGLWQFKINSSKMFDLVVNSYVDERMDPLKSTEAACQYLQYLYKIFNDWHLALAAYNTGPGAVRNAIIRANGETNFWKIYDFLPEAAQNYVPAFIAAGYIMNNAAMHKIEKTKPTIVYTETDTVMVVKPVAFTTISKELDIPIEIVRFLNPVYRRDFMPDMGKPLVLWLPSDKIKLFVKKEQVIYNTKVDHPTFHDVLANSGNIEGKIKIQHRVKSGEYLHKIAIIYGCTIDDILAWNPNADNNLNKGEYLDIWIDKKDYQRIQQWNSADSLRSKTSQQ